MVEFVSYTGRFPNLCSGILTVRIDGKEVTFGGYNGKADFPRIWNSGGSVSFDNDWTEHVTHGAWEVNDWSAKEITDPNIKNRLEEIIEIMNKNVPHGCCGGCV